MSIGAARTHRSDEACEGWVAPHLRELRGHCYRMLGSLHESEDALQETVKVLDVDVRGIRAITGFTDPSLVSRF